MKVTVAKVHENLFSGEAEVLMASTTEGDMTILPHHEPIVATLKPGKLVVRSGGSDTSFEITDGVLEVSNNQVTVLL